MVGRALFPIKKRGVSRDGRTAKRTRSTPSRSIVRIPASMGPFPAKSSRTLQYKQEITINLVAGFGTFYMSANGMFNPSLTAVGGHQPLYFDQLMGIYEHYHVTSSKIKVHFATPVTAPGDYVYLACSLDNDQTTSATNAFTIGERPGADFAVINSNGHPSRNVVVNYVKNKLLATDTNTRGDVTTNPGEQINFLIGLQAGSTTGNMSLVVEMEYTANFDDPIGIASS